MNKEAKLVSKAQMSEFLELHGNKWLEYSYSKCDNPMIWTMKFRLDDMDEILNFWKQKGFEKFINLTLIFER